MLRELLRIHNQGHSRLLGLPAGEELLLDDGWHNLRNDLTGTIGYTFELSEDRAVTHLGMWDDHDRERPVRPARGIPTENERDQPSRTGKKPRTLKSPHSIILWEMRGKVPNQITRVEMKFGSPGELDGEFRYLKLDQPVKLRKGTRYLLTTSTKAGDGDHFHDPAPYDGLSPLLHPCVIKTRGVLFRKGDMEKPLAIPAFGDLHPDYSAFRLPVGPTLRFGKD